MASASQQVSDDLSAVQENGPRNQDPDERNDAPVGSAEHQRHQSGSGDSRTTAAVLARSSKVSMTVFARIPATTTGAMARISEMASVRSVQNQVSVTSATGSRQSARAWEGAGTCRNRGQTAGTL